MQIPKKAPKQKLVDKACEVPGCGKVFRGVHSAKYCEQHRDPQCREKKKKPVEDVTIHNQIIAPDETGVKTVMLTCALEGCGESFEVKLYPKQFVYPKYCLEHRNEHKRAKHLEKIGAAQGK